MQQPSQSRELRVADPDQAAAFADAFRRRLLIAFIDGPKTIGAACAEIPDLQVSASKAFYHAMRLEKLGLIRRAGEQPRRGRALKLYRAVARAFFVPRALMAAGPEAGIAAEMRARLDEEAARRQDGLLFTRTESGGPLVRPVVSGEGGADARAAPAFEIWRIMALKPSQARALAEELRALLGKYGKPESGPARGARPYLFHAAMAQRK